MDKSKYHFRFEDLQVYQKAIEFGVHVNDLTMTVPKEELYKLSSQFSRAVDSIAYNIAGESASTDMNFNRYLKMAWDSSHECVTASTKARLMGYISFSQDEENRRLLTEIGKMISALRSHLKKKF